ARDLRVAAGRRADEQVAAFRPAEHAGERLLLDTDALRDRAALAHAQDLCADRRGDPDRALGIEADAVWYGALERRPDAPIAQRSVRVDVESRQTSTVRLADDQSAAVRHDHGAVREQHVVGGHARLPVGSTSAIAAGHGVAPPCRSKPKLPT